MKAAPKAPVKQETPYEHYKRLVDDFGTKFKREGDIALAMKLLEKIVLKPQETNLNPEQTLGLGQALGKTIEALQAKFGTQEHQLNVLIKSLEPEKRNHKKPAPLAEGIIKPESKDTKHD